MTTKTPLSRSRLPAVATVGAPVALLAGLAVLKLGWAGRYDLPWSTAVANWTVGHAFSLLANALLLVAMFAIYQRLSHHGGPGGRLGSRAHAAAGLALSAGVLGAVTMMGQMVINVRNGLLAGSRADLRELSSQVHAVPELDVLFYGLLPSLAMVGLVVLIILLASVQDIPATAAAVAVVASILLGVGATWSMLAGGALLCLAMAPVAHRVDHGPRTVATH